MPQSGVYTLSLRRTSISTAISILQIVAGAEGLEILRVVVGQKGSTTSQTEAISLVRKSVAATVTAAILGTSLFRHNPLETVTAPVLLSTGGTGIMATVEGTDTDEVYSDTFNVLNGKLYVPTEKERIYVPPAGIIALKFHDAPVAQTWTASITFGLA